MFSARQLTIFKQRYYQILVIFKQHYYQVKGPVAYKKIYV